MSYATRSRRIPILLSANSHEKISRKRRITKNTAKEKNNTKSTSTREFKQDENTVLLVNYNEESTVKNSQAKTLISESKLHSTEKINSLVYKGTVLTKDMPVLRDKTNTINKHYKVEARPLNTNEIPLIESKKISKTYVDKKAITCNDQKLLSTIKILVERYSNKEPIIQKVDLMNNNSEKSKIKLPPEKQIKNISNKVKLIKMSKENSSKVNKIEKMIEPNININNDETQKPISNKKTNSQDPKVVSNRVLRKKCISIEEVKKLLNEDDEPIPIISDKVRIKQKPAKENKIIKVTTSTDHNEINDIVQEQIINKNSSNNNVKPRSLCKAKVNKNQIIPNKFFKNKVSKNEIKPIINVKKNPQRQVNKIIRNNDSTLNPKSLKQRKSMRPVETKLRPRTNINYCEMTRLSQSFNAGEKESADTEKPTDKNTKTVPIYKNIKLSQENIKDKEEIYNFPDESQEKVQNNKKRKKTVKRPTVKRVKKITTPRIFVSQEKQMTRIKNGPTTAHFKQQNKKATVNVNNIQSYKIPEYLNDAGESTIQELSTIIISNDNLEGSKKIALTVTPSIPKTITSELKLFGPKNAITSQPTTQYSNMVNHSLIRKSMSPISKLDENFDAGSPWRPTDTFFRVHQIVQSTPHINRLPSMREKKLPIHKINLNKKSISSDDTIHALSNINDKTSNKKENTRISVVKKNETSPRKFGTILSNLSPVQSKNIHNIHNKNSIKNNQQSQMESLQIQFPEFSANDEEITPISKDNKENNNHNNNNNNNNTISSPKKIFKNEFSTPSPFRFDKLQSTKKIVSEKKSPLQELNEQSKSDRASLCSEKAKPIILRQSNLNNFLNLDQMPQQTCISTVHGIFSDVHSTPINEKKRRKLTKEPNIKNAFGFDDSDESELSSVDDTSTSIITAEEDLIKSRKENMSSKIKIKSVVSTNILQNAVQKPALKSALKKQKPEEKVLEVFNKNVDDKENDEFIEKVKYNDKLQSTEKSVLDSMSFSDTFDILCEKKEIKLPDEIPLFVDFEPAHFNEPPRRSYQKRKREVNFNISTNNFVSEDNEPDQPKSKKKKVSKIIKEERKRVNEWVKNINETFEEIDQYDLIVE